MVGYQAGYRYDIPHLISTTTVDQHSYTSKNSTINKTATAMMIRSLLLTVVAICVFDASAFVSKSTMPILAPREQVKKSSTSMSAFSVSRTLVGGAAVFCFSKSFEVVRQGDVAVVERLGKFHKRLDPGLHVIVPFIDQVRGTLTTREQVFDIPPQKCITSDNAPLSADAVVYWGVVDPYRALYSVVNLEMAIQNLVLTQLRAEIGKLTLDMTFSAREQINAVLLQDLDVATAPWGIKISRVEGKGDNLRSIIPRLHGLTFVRSITKFETLFQTARL
jgi:hypothetical protein